METLVIVIYNCKRPFFIAQIINEFTQIKLLSSFQSKCILFNRIIAENNCMQIVRGTEKVDDEKSNSKLIHRDSIEIKRNSYARAHALVTNESERANEKKFEQMTVKHFYSTLNKHDRMARMFQSD